MNEITLLCDCGSEVLIGLEFEAYGKEPQHFCFDIYTRLQNKRRLRERIKLAVKLLFKKDQVLDGVILNGPKAAKLAQFIISNLNHD